MVEKSMHHPFLVLHDVKFEIIWLTNALFWFTRCSDYRHDVLPVNHGSVSNGVRSSTASYLVSLRDGLMEHHTQSLLQTLLSSLRGTIYRGY